MIESIRVAVVRALPVVSVVLAAGVASLSYVPVFGIPVLAWAVGIPVAAVLAAALACSGRVLEAWRPVATAAAGLVAVAATSLWPTTFFGLPTVRTLRALAAGITDSWRLALQSTWPARPDAELLLFLPIMVVLAAVFGVELVRRLRGPLPALLPSLAVAVFAQLYATPPVETALLAALAYAAAAMALLATVRSATGVPESGTAPRADPQPRAALARAVPVVVLVVAGAVAAGLLPAEPRPAYTLREEFPAPVPDTRAASPLDEIGGRLASPAERVFNVSGAPRVDRWPLVVLDDFDGVNWKPGNDYRRLGTELPKSPRITVPAERRTARIEIPGGSAALGPWLPTRSSPNRVKGVAPLVEENQGTLLLPRPGDPGPLRYSLSWWEPRVDAAALASAAIDPRAPGGLGGVGRVPDGVTELARRAVGGRRATFATALALERYLRENYRLATGEDIPTGHAWPQLARFLLETKRGTSEQFAAAYVVLARIRGIPARLVAGYRVPPGAGDAYTVRNGDVLAWPEVAVAGVGWVPLDPAGSARASATGEGGLADATSEVRRGLPPEEDLRDPPVRGGERSGRDGPAAGDDDGPVRWALPLLPGGLLPVGWVLGVPAAKAWRARRRRQRPGRGAVVGAWEEVRDLLRAYGVTVSASMTLRDLTAAATPVVDPSTVPILHGLAVTADRALWSGHDLGDQPARDAWSAVRAIRRSLSHRGLWARLRAILDPRPLFRPPS